MRTIKFRGKDEFTEEWKIGSLVMVEGSPLIIEGEDIEKDGHHFRQASDRPCDVIPESVGQSTGLHDVAGVEIYEGDIIKAITPHGEPTIYRVIYNERTASFGAECHSWQCYINQDWINGCGFSVIGNIHDNPELMQWTLYEKEGLD